MLKDIISSHPQGSSITVGVDGGWGDGKTSIVRTAKQQLSNRDDLIWVEFESWRYPTEKDLIMGFYDQIGRAISDVLPSMRNERALLLGFAKSIVKLSEKSSGVSDLLSLIKNNTQSEMKYLSKKLKRFGKRIVLVIDDLDRLLEHELVYRSLQLSYVLKTTDIKGTIVVIPADFIELKKALTLDEDNEYLQKISEINITVLPPSVDEIIDFCKPYIKDELNFSPNIFRMIRNLRGAIRVINNYRLLLDRLDGQVQKSDVFSMCVLSYAAPNVYLDIRNNPNMYVDLDSENDINWQFMDDDKKYEIRARHIKNILSSYEPEIRRMDLTEMLNDTFYVAKNALQENKNNRSSVDHQALERNMSIGLAFYLKAFFSHSEAAISVSISRKKNGSFVEQYRNTPEDQKTIYAINFFKDIDYIKALRLLRDIAKFQLEFEDGDMDLNLAHDILAVYLDKTEYLIRDESDTLISILSSIDRHVRHDEQKLTIFNGLEKYFRHPSSALRLLLYINPDRNNQMFSLKSYSEYSSLRRKILKRIDKFYLLEGNNIITEDSSGEGEWRFTAYQWGMSVSGDNKKDIVFARRKKVESYITGLLKNDELLLHEFIMKNYYNLDLMIKKKRFTLETDEPYNLNSIKRLAVIAVNNPNTSLDETSIANLRLFIEAYKKYKIKNKTATPK